MANVKDIYIEGWLPFDAGAGMATGGVAKEKSDALLRMIGQLHMPAMGTQIEWERGQGKQKKVPNQYGGQTTLYHFVLSGQEALNWKYLDYFKELVAAVGGEIVADDTEDLEA